MALQEHRPPPHKRRCALAGEQRGVAVAHESKCKQAVAHYRAAAHMQLGEALDAEGRDDQAIREFDAAVRASPPELKARFGLRYLFGREGRFPDAAGQSHAELKIEPDDNQSLTYQGGAELQLRRRPQAEAHLREALRLDPNSHLTQLDLRILFTDENKPSRSSPRYVVAAAERRIREAARLDPSGPDGHYHLGRLLLRMGQRKEAMQEFAEIKGLARQKQPDRRSEEGHEA